MASMTAAVVVVRARARAVLAAVAALLALDAAPAAAGPRRGGLYGGGALGGEAVTSGDRTGAGVVFVGQVGYLVPTAARLGFEAQGLGGQAWIDGARRVDGVILAAARLWATDRISISAGLGVAAGDDNGGEQVVGAGAAAGATFAIDLHRTRKRVLALRAHAFGGDFEDARAIHVGLTLGLEWYGLTTPTPGP
jgi:hypothetical protein